MAISAIGTGDRVTGDLIVDRARQDDESTTELARRMEFFRLCVRMDNPDEKSKQEHRGILNNSDINYVAQELRWAGNEWQRNLRHYLRAKFAYFEGLSNRQAPSTADIAARLGFSDYPADISSQVEEITAFWARIADAESRGLILRLDQLPVEVVTSEWYFACEEFDHWRTAALAARAAELETDWRVRFQADYRQLLDGTSQAVEVETEPSKRQRDHVDRRRAVAEAIHERASRISERVSSHLLGLDAQCLDVAVDGALYAEVAIRDNESAAEEPCAPGRIVAEVATTLLRPTVASTQPLAGEHLLQEFTVAVASAVDCDFCDFLHWDGDVLRPVANSNPTASLAKLMQLPYRKGEGISGSAVLVPADSPRRYVGTNDLSSDPRGSARHADAYAGEVGPIRDYWVFPVFEGGEIIGAFRVVNRAEGRRTAGVPWSAGLLGELHALALWFEEELLSSIGTLSTNGSRRRSQRVTDISHGGAIQSLRSGCELDWIDHDFFAELVIHICSVAFRRVEKTSLGCSVGVFPTSDLPTIFDRLPDYKVVKPGGIADLDEAGTLYPRVSPTAGMFVFGDAGGPGRVVSLRGHQGTGAEAIKHLTRDRDRAAVFMLERGQDCVRLITKGDVAADYYMSDAAGVWTPRIYAPLLEHVLENRPESFPEANVIHAFQLAADLSYMRVGAMIVLADELPDDVSLVGGEDFEHLILENLSREIEAADLARIDGAMQINSAGAVVRCGAFVRRKHSTILEPEQLGAAGSRHRAARDLSSVAMDALVFVVSENRPMSVFLRGNRVLDGV
jgi:hypothetical protein